MSSSFVYADFAYLSTVCLRMCACDKDKIAEKYTPKNESHKREEITEKKEEKC